MADNRFPPLPRLLPSRSNEIQAGNSIRLLRVDWAGGWSGSRADFVAPSDGLKNSVPLLMHVDLSGCKVTCLYTEIKGTSGRRRQAYNTYYEKSGSIVCSPYTNHGRTFGTNLQATKQSLG
jgi:hypothetical protein